VTDRHGPPHIPDDGDRFTRWGEDATSLLEAHWRRLLGAAVVLFVLGGTWVVYDRHRGTREAEAQAEVAHIADQFPGALGSNVPESSIRDAAGRYEAFLKDAPSGPARFTAQLYLAQAHEAVGEMDKARTAYEALQNAPRPFSGPARLRLAYLALSQGDTQGASAAFEKVVADDPGLAPQAALELGRVAEQLGQTDAAIAAYRNVSEQFGSTPQAAEAQARIRALGGEPETPAPEAVTAPEEPGADTPTEPAAESAPQSPDTPETPAPQAAP
jgi:tetratricopeptide (TPR) repeat protein